MVLWGLSKKKLFDTLPPLLNKPIGFITKLLEKQFKDSPLQMLQASCLQQLYYCAENKLAKKSTTLKQPGQIQKGLQPIKTHY